MSRSSASSQQRQLSLPEELEKLEQSITLTLQEIDHNFSKAHRIVTSSILPIVEQYAEHSKAVWEGSKFWKQFFESSANVSLSGYEEQPSVLERTDETITEDSNATHTTLETSQSYETPSSHHLSAQPVEEQLDMTSLTISPSNTTPRPNANGKAKAGTTATFADYPSPYEDLRKEIGTTNNSQADGPHTPGKTPTAAAPRPRHSNDARLFALPAQTHLHPVPLHLPQAHRSPPPPRPRPQLPRPSNTHGQSPHPLPHQRNRHGCHSHPTDLLPRPGLQPRARSAPTARRDLLLAREALHPPQHRPHARHQRAHARETQKHNPRPKHKQRHLGRHRGRGHGLLQLRRHEPAQDDAVPRAAEPAAEDAG